MKRITVSKKDRMKARVNRVASRSCEVLVALKELSEDIRDRKLGEDNEMIVLNAEMRRGDYSFLRQKDEAQEWFDPSFQDWILKRVGCRKAPEKLLLKFSPERRAGDGWTNLRRSRKAVGGWWYRDEDGGEFMLPVSSLPWMWKPHGIAVFLKVEEAATKKAATKKAATKKTTAKKTAAKKTAAKKAAAKKTAAKKAAAKKTATKKTAAKKTE